MSGLSALMDAVYCRLQFGIKYLVKSFAFKFEPGWGRKRFAIPCRNGEICLVQTRKNDLGKSHFLLSIHSEHSEWKAVIVAGEGKKTKYSIENL